MKRILFVCPGVWDEEALARPDLTDGREIVRTGGELVDDPSPWQALTFDALAWIRRTAQRFGDARIGGVVGTGDYPGCQFAAGVAEALGLPTPSLDVVTRLSHKLYSREIQRRLVPEATPTFEAFDPFARPRGPRGLRYPFFIKPVKGTMSIRAALVRDRDELDRALRFSWRERIGKRMLLGPFRQLLGVVDPRVPAHWFVAESPLSGAQVTVDGFVQGGRTTIMGIVDSVMYPGTNSFMRFDYPSRLPDAVQARMRDLVRRLMDGSGFDASCFNVELFWNHDTDAIHVIEVNPRMSYQFADLYERVDGMHTYRVQFALSCGEPVDWRPRAGRDRAATSFVLRRFRDGLVRAVPSADTLRALATHDGALVKILCKVGDRLSAHDQDPGSFRYAIANVGAETVTALEARWLEIERQLRFEFAD